MKKLRILFAAFYISAPLLLALRVIQQLFLIDQATGLMNKSAGAEGTAVTVVFFAVIPVLIVLAALSRFEGVCVPRHSSKMAVGSFLLAAALIFDSADRIVSAAGSVDYLMVALSLVGAVAFAWQGVSLISDLALPAVMPLMSVLWAAARVVEAFIGYTGEVTVTGCYFHMVTLCLTLVTLWMLAKRTFGISSDKNAVMLFGFGLSAALFCADHVLGKIIALFAGIRLYGETMPDAVSLAMVFYILFALHSVAGSNGKDRLIAGAGADFDSTPDSDAEVESESGSDSAPGTEYGSDSADESGFSVTAAPNSETDGLYDGSGWDNDSHTRPDGDDDADIGENAGSSDGDESAKG